MPFEEPFSIAAGGELRTYEKSQLIEWFRTLERQSLPLRDPLTNELVFATNGATAQRAEEVAMYPNRTILEQVNALRARDGLPPREITRSQLWIPTRAPTRREQPQTGIPFDHVDLIHQEFRINVATYTVLHALSGALAAGVGAGVLNRNWSSVGAHAASTAVGGAVVGALYGFFCRSDNPQWSLGERTGAYLALTTVGAFIGAGILRAHGLGEVDPKQAAVVGAAGTMVLMLGSLACAAAWGLRARG